tara:strand:+ start:144 stop:551 length:408 start_codon:yes stop_codon:yes gene_type:complete
VKSKSIIVFAISILAGLGTLFPVIAQEGHPMDGSWVGDWGLTSQDRQRVLIVLQWTGSALVGTINPGANAIPITTATADPGDWRLHAVAAGVDAAGRPVTYTIDGTIDDLGTYNRTIAGTWQVGSNSGDFSITRQ